MTFCKRCNSLNDFLTFLNASDCEDSLYICPRHVCLCVVIPLVFSVLLCCSGKYFITTLMQLVKHFRQFLRVRDNACQTQTLRCAPSPHTPRTGFTSLIADRRRVTILWKVATPLALCEHSKSFFRTHKNCKCIARIYYIPFALFELKLDRALRLHAVVLFV